MPRVLFSLILFAATLSAQPASLGLKFSFGPKSMTGYTQVAPAAVYTSDAGYGFDLGSRVVSNASSVAGRNGRPFFFSAKLAPGAYRVTVTLGDASAASTTTVKSETRRLMLESVQTGAGTTVQRSFLVHLRQPQIPGGGMVALKPRERDPINYVEWDDHTRIPFYELDWDEKLTLEFSDPHAALDSIEITPAGAHTTVYLIGDSTVTDQMMEPWGAWGMWLPRWFQEPVLIANYAESGETTASFIGERRWPKLLSEIHPGDFVLMQFGINDRRIPLDRFKQYFVQFIQETRQHGATPVLVTSQNLRRLDSNGKAVETLGGYPEAMREVAREQKTALIDLNAMSEKLYDAIGAARLPDAFVDGTHQNDYGSYELAKCVVNGIREADLPFARYLVEAWKPFDPAHPDPIDSWALPPDPQLDPARPKGPLSVVRPPVQPAAPFHLKLDLATQAPPGMLYSKSAGYGYEPGFDATNGKPEFFSVAVPEGNYKVTVTFGDAKTASDNTVYAELRRLMVGHVHTAPGQFEARTFIVNVRQPKIAGAGEVRLTGREKTMEAWAWDDRLTLEFNGAHPAVSALEIDQVSVPTIFLMGDSTVCDQPREPYNSWGQMITGFFKPTVAVSNQAESGESIAGALGKGRLDKIWSDMKKGDYLLIQFGHNDMKSPAVNALALYTDMLRAAVEETRKRGGIPILFTPVSRRTFNAEGKITNSFNGYPDAVKLVAKERNVPLIDLQEMAAAFYEAMGPDTSHKAFATPAENTHHGDYGSYEIAKAIVQRVRDLKLPLAGYLVENLPAFDPGHPDRFEDFDLPPSPRVTTVTPLGN
ncbi:MAG TPA: rhamnogalacturonan acetylesterase [Bryobacteraceae bacterium]|nr:rhamnogalacturonan acetylesterase [Bryobacteraceae bacterium]